jgi:hypothetical protein
MMRTSSRRFPAEAFARLLILALAAAIFDSCAGGERPSIAVEREQLFTLGYGQAEDQLNLFQVDRVQAIQKTCLTMREGFFYVANGAGAKVVRYSSFGDSLSMIYNADRNPEPIVLKVVTAPSDARIGETSDSEGLDRRAVPYPFRSVGALAVDSSQTLYVEDRLPPERRVQDKDTGAFLDRIVLRFGKDGRFLDYLGQEGIGGTPFPYILGIYTVSSSDAVIVSMLQTAWLVHWFDKSGVLVSSIRLRRGDLPLPEKGQDLIASLDKIVPDVSGQSLLIKIDYYRNTIDPATKDSTGSEFASSWIYRMDIKDGKYVDRWQVHVMERTAKTTDGQTVKFVRAPGFLGAAGRDFFFIYADDDGKTYVSTDDRTTRATVRYSIDIAPDELYYDTYYLSPDGVLCALLGTRYEGRVVWWRFDKLIGAAGAGFGK